MNLNMSDDMRPPFKSQSETFWEDEPENCSYYVTTPAEANFNPQFKKFPRAFQFYSLLSGFFTRAGYAYCSNEWLVKQTGTSLSTVKRILTLLEEEGFIFRETWTEGVKHYRRIWKRECYDKYIKEKEKKSKNKYKGPHVSPSKVHTRARPSLQPLSSNYNKNIITTTPLPLHDSEPKSDPPVTHPPPSSGAAHSPPARPSSFFFAKNKKYLKGQTAERIAEVREAFESKMENGEIDHPEAWLTQCFKEGWEFKKLEEKPSQPTAEERKAINQPKAERLMNDYPDYVRILGETVTVRFRKLDLSLSLRSEEREFDQFLYHCRKKMDEQGQT